MRESRVTNGQRVGGRGGARRPARVRSKDTRAGRGRGARSKKTKGVKRATGLRGQSRVGGGARVGKTRFHTLGKRDGCGAVVVVGERVGGKLDEAIRSVEVEVSLESTGGGGGARRWTRTWPRLCLVLAAMGHVERAKMMAKLVEGPGTYRTLQRVTGLKAGPLYHHINQLRLAGLILPKQRDLYELTRGGRNLILAAVALAPLTRDSRRRPVVRV